MKCEQLALPDLKYKVHIQSVNYINCNRQRN